MTSPGKIRDVAVMVRNSKNCISQRKNEYDKRELAVSSRWRSPAGNSFKTAEKRVSNHIGIIINEHTDLYSKLVRLADNVKRAEKENVLI